jgi:hypothetical protein
VTAEAETVDDVVSFSTAEGIHTAHVDDIVDFTRQETEEHPEATPFFGDCELNYATPTT